MYLVMCSMHYRTSGFKPMKFVWKLNLGDDARKPYEFLHL